MANLTTDTSRTNGLVPEFKNKIQHVDGQLQSAAHDAGEKLGTMASGLASKTAASVRTSREYIKENPAKGAAIAAAAGLVAGSLLTMIMRRSKS